VPLAGQTFRVGGALLRLSAVDDLAGAAKDTALRNHAQAFALTFDGPPNALGPAAQTVTHPAIGAFSLLVTPVGRVEGNLQRYEAVIDRSVGRPSDPPGPPRHLPERDEHPGSEEAAAAALAEFKADVASKARQTHRRAVRRRRLKRRQLKRRRAANRAAANRRALVKRQAERGRYTAARRGAATVIR
jgi:hypothetical protein